ncbi:2-dehydro-3-deoxy-6-phosphogalactonate aldolase [Chelativorans intermedius]|uniref:2-dehydro-3-deoxy-6-phosphogalactonate aldolase n=1 Tax=Chelativorans intermedius TaxID=515947 RepID=A0ABV6D919_9HYPH|nr:2-dehydro-3-deoxy-6-phosphogalactonate aldolase [Chelativorans intermedius]MCT8998706.1 2-dehydro-3-deoxy-6-phosphogalactonate aldolase [Chelativorans intermedius]
MNRIAWPKLTRDLVAILRGLRPEEAPAIVGALVEAGFEAIEVPLNSPDPFRSIEAARRLAPEGVLIGAGTVLSVEEVDRLNDAGGNLLVSPNVDPAVIARAGRHGMITMPGVFSPTEALAAVSAGASALKFFPASVLGPKGIKAIMAVLPDGVPVGAVGGVSERDFVAYAAVGVRTFGLGSSLYRPAADAAEVATRARAAVAAYDAVFGG